MKLGTILPTAESLTSADAHADAQLELRIAKGDSMFGKHSRYIVGEQFPEYRWKVAEGYAIITRNMKPILFKDIT